MIRAGVPVLAPRLQSSLREPLRDMPRRLVAERVSYGKGALPAGRVVEEAAFDAGQGEATGISN